uniref:Uncharacterized protein n=1 Tax=Romanomermis culicivorax TaxID=13658 RepID=A0A915INW9_ROMCU
MDAKSPGVDPGMVEAKLEEVLEGGLSDPTEAEETGKAKAQMRNFTTGILTCLATAVEAMEAKTKAKIRAKTEARPKAKARGDTI